jgi:hypothetical protein
MLPTSYELQLFELSLSGLNEKNSDLFRIIGYELVWDFTQNWAYSKLFKIPQKYWNIEFINKENNTPNDISLNGAIFINGYYRELIDYSN